MGKDSSKALIGWITLVLVSAVILLVLLCTSFIADSPGGPASRFSSDADHENQLNTVLGGISTMPEVAWVRFDRNTVYVGFRERPPDLHALIRAWALQGNFAINFGCHVWAIDGTQAGRDWEPGDTGLWAEVTARYGKIR